jgi:hypothetical protein
VRAAAPWVVYVAACVVFWGAFAEDAYIVARYAANLAEGHGLVYNLGERVNALTSPGHVFLLAPLQAATGRAVEPYAFVMALLTAAAFWRGVPKLFADPLRRQWFLCGALAFPPLVFWTVGGLETPLITLAAFGLLVAWIWPGLAARRRSAWVLAFAGAAMAARYDAILLVGPPALFALYAGRKNAATWISGVAVAAALLGWLAFCATYFGGILPTSFYAKNPTVVTAGFLLKGACYLSSFAVLLFAPLALGRLAGKSPAMREEAPPVAVPLWPLAAGLALLLAYGLSAGIKHMMYAYRLFVPCVPWIVFLALARARALPGAKGLWIALAFQAALTLVIYHKSLNFNLTVLIKDQSPPADEVFEFSTVGGRYSKKADLILAAQARVLRAHWEGTGRLENREAVPRMASITAGQPPYELRGFHVLDLLMGFRKRCSIDYYAASHYRQHITWLRADGAEIGASPGEPWKPVVREDLAIDLWGGKRTKLRLAWFYRPHPEPNRLPPTVDAPCLAR